MIGYDHTITFTTVGTSLIKIVTTRRKIDFDFLEKENFENGRRIKSLDGNPCGLSLSLVTLILFKSFMGIKKG